MTDPEDPIDPARLSAVRHDATNRLGVFFEAEVIDRISQTIIEKVGHGAVGDGILHRELVSESGAPSWVGHAGLLGPVLALVSIQSYESQGILLSALTRARKDQSPPTPGFCGFLEQLGLVASRDNREECLEMWDYQWKLAITQLETQARARRRRRDPGPS